MRKISRVLYLFPLCFCMSAFVFSQLLVASPFPGDEAIVAGNVTLDLALSQRPIETNQSAGPNASTGGNDTTQANQTLLSASNKT
jgi:hypothetical protein